MYYNTQVLLKLEYDLANSQRNNQPQSKEIIKIRKSQGGEDIGSQQGMKPVTEAHVTSQPIHVSQHQHELGKNSSHETGIICVQGYKVKQSIAPILESIFKKHGDVAANCVFKADSVRSLILEGVCEVVSWIQTDDVIDKMKEIECHVADAKAANIDVSWLQAHLQAIKKSKEAGKKCRLLIETKTNTVLVKRAAEMDLRESSVELMAAEKRFQKAKRCVRVLRLVEKNLNDNFLEYKARMESWVDHDPVI